MTDISQGVRDDYVLNANQAGVIIGRDSQTIRRWYYDKHTFLKDYPDFLVRVPNENRGQPDVLISARVLLKVAQDKGLRIDMDKVEQELSDRPDLVDLFREDAAHSSSRPTSSGSEEGRNEQDPRPPREIERDPRDAERIEELKGEREEWKTKAERLQEELSTEKDKRINLLGGLTVFNGFANRMIGAAKRGTVDVRFIPTLPQPDNDGNLIFPDVVENEPAPEPVSRIVEATVMPPKKKTNWVPWAATAASLLVAGSTAAYVFLPKLLG